MLNDEINNMIVTLSRAAYAHPLHLSTGQHTHGPTQDNVFVYGLAEGAEADPDDARPSIRPR